LSIQSQSAKRAKRQYSVGEARQVRVPLDHLE
jgi:hypothetical protein